MILENSTNKNLLDLQDLNILQQEVFFLVLLAFKA